MSIPNLPSKIPAKLPKAPAAAKAPISKVPPKLPGHGAPVPVSAPAPIAAPATAPRTGAPRPQQATLASLPGTSTDSTPETPASPGATTVTGGASRSGPAATAAAAGPPSKTTISDSGVVKKTLRDDLKDAALGRGAPTAPGQKQSIRSSILQVGAEAAKGAASGAAKGAAAGGVGALPGAALGAAKSAGMAVAKNKRLRNMLIAVVAFLLVIPVAVAGASIYMLSASTGSVDAFNQVTAQRAASEEHVDEDSMGTAHSLGTKYGIPWTIVASLENKDAASEETLDAISKELSRIDPQVETRSLDVGGRYVPGTAQREIDQENGSDKANSDAVRKTYTDAIVGGAGMTEAQATGVYDTALRWWMGQAETCPVDGGSQSGGSTNGMTVKGVPMNADQRAIAVTIVGISKSATRNMDVADQRRAAEITMATGIVESVLANNPNKVDHTSLGVFQQQDWWGSDSQRLDVPWSTARFLLPLLQLPGWNTMEPGKAAQKIQVSAFPDAYAERMSEAVNIVSTLWNEVQPQDIPAGFSFDGNGGSAQDGGAGAPADTDAPITCGVPAVSGTWGYPFNGIVTVNSWWGPRVSPGGVGSKNHQGVDFGKPADGLMISIGDGVVTGKQSTPGHACGYWITVLNPDGGEARYCHMVNPTDLNVGDTVVKGQTLGLVGSTGNSTGPHIHLNINLNGVPVDPYDYLKERGVDLDVLPTWGGIGPH
ncbi:M23 family metallopeptidase [Frigoribacterium sp. SL97]|uniref:M23 family metallopeptidase n=1 Tax=Frigoribacterium sp. SL97 TaxID=2994664 RepID=UPI00226F515B|nr:M23 family metallopeptidase [Frigoribacterium sp. SL97]WAC50341.1 M23 family metallopeptidase [Frigoribacterium sp. SL97]